MKILFTLLLAVCAIVFIPACGKRETPAPEKSCHFQQNGYLQRVSWNSLPVTIYADLSLSEEEVTAFEDAMEIWNNALKKERKGGKSFKFGGILQAHVGLKNDFINVISSTTNWTGSKTEQAETLLMWEGTSIIEADIRMNGTKEYSSAAEGEPGKIDLVALYVHELGHVLGLVHIEPKDGAYTAMSPYLERGDVERREVGPIELDALKCEY
jgi:hypothetical protein